MAIRQYIGARYVPAFSDVNGGVWDNTYTYDALTIVKNGNDFYTSKKAVPAGIAITNTDYWVLTGNYNAAIQALDDKIDNIQGVVDNKHKMILCIGDSYGMSDGTTPTTSGWCGAFYRAAQDNGLDWDIYYIAYSGAGFVADIGHHLYIDMLQEWITAHAALAETLTDIIVCNGYNDAYYYESPTPLNSAIDLFMDYVRDFKEDIKVHIGFIGYTNESEVYPKLAPTCRATRDAAQTYGANWIENAQYSTRNFATFNDTRHPNTNGYNYVGKFLLRYMENGYADVDIEETYNINGAGSFTQLTNYPMIQHRHNGHVITRSNTSAYLGSLTGTLADTITINTNGVTNNELVTVGSKLIYVDSNKTVPTCGGEGILRTGSSSNIVWNQLVKFGIAGQKILFSYPRTGGSQTTATYEVSIYCPINIVDSDYC